ncbi:DUF4367 domain-containing protein [Bacillus sp. EB01]|uniref:DUF4367 domain-containing protein n=1 Tax=Bacillus sp. EB01 TaxID=1347086 RepID=UPI001E2F9635|nr:DUF4367 domain-containing protein [Bacillus sp. EB01]
MIRQLVILIFVYFMIPVSPNFSKALELSVQEKEIKYNHNSITIPEIKQNVHFNVIVPKNVPDDWTLEIKTYPWGAKTKFTHFRLHYMDKNDEKMMVSIKQIKGSMKRTEENNQNAKSVSINGYSGNQIKWGNDGEVDSKGEIVTGGILQWTQEGTYIEMYSSRIPMENMLEIARSMK